MQEKRVSRMGRTSALLLTAALFFLLWGIHGGRGALGTPLAQTPQRAHTAGETTVALSDQFSPAANAGTGPEYGVVFMSSAEAPADEQQYANALSTGASWNRWPIYWFYVERNADEFDWTAQDQAVLADVEHGLQLNAILLGTPCFYRSGDPCQAPYAPTAPRPPQQISLARPETAAPQGLYEPVFADGTDRPGPDKAINSANRWARFVFMAVDRYRPGGVLAQLHNWPAGAGVTHWEMWNEPDLEIFWDGSVEDYARLLKVGYLAAKQADANAQVLFGGLAYFEEDGFLEQVLALYDADPLAPAHNYFHDILAVHNYFQSWESWYYVWRAERALAAHGLARPIWLNESGVAAWNDYPGPVWDPSSGLRATTQEQADFVIQSALYATFAGADVIFHFQLYDGCGNQPSGTDFPPHNGELCDENGRLQDNPDFPCAGDANGLFRNPQDAVCFSQHPQPETPRPNYDAFRVLTTYVRDVQPLWRLRPGGPDPATAPQEWIAFYKPETDERVLGMWARYGDEETAVVPALSDSALLIAPDGATETLTPSGGQYTITLPGATNRNAFWDPNLYAIGGRPYLLIDQDLAAPVVAVQAPPFAWRETVSLSWSGDDGLGGGLQDYTITVAVDGGSPATWLTNTAATSGDYPVQVGHTYTFAVTARDRAGNVSRPAVVTLAAIEPETVFAPLIAR